jgi:hypothetical protein
MKGNIYSVDKDLFFVYTEFYTGDNRVTSNQKRYKVMESEKQSFSNGQEVEADIFVINGVERAVVRKVSFKDTYTPEEKANELISYFRNYRFFMGEVDAKIMALRIVDEMIKNPAIKEDWYRGASGSNIEYKSFWRDVKFIIQGQPLKQDNNDAAKPKRDPEYGC